MADSLNETNRVWTALQRRADRATERDRLHAAFVEADYFSPASENDSMVLFGRRGAGKTHTLLQLEHLVRKDGNVPIFVDMRALGSNAGIYDNPEMPFATRASRLLVDLIEAIHESLFELSLRDGREGLASVLHQLGPALDHLADASTQVRVTGSLSVTEETTSKASRGQSKRTSARLARKGTSVDLDASRSEELSGSESVTITRDGVGEFYIHLGTVGRAVHGICAALAPRRLWLLIDEWSEGVPLELQPVLADMLRRTFMRVPAITLKIMAIEHRSSFRSQTPAGGYVGLELGADTAETVVLDASLTIGNETGRASAFLRQLLSEHYIAAAAEFTNLPDTLTSETVIDHSFKRAAFDTLVLASEGNPRDAINLASRAARQARRRVITEQDVLAAARDYFWNTKYKNIEGEKALESLFRELMAKSISRRRRTFLIERQDSRRRLYNKLYDNRLIHLLKSGIRITAGDGAYDGYAIDFGCYADRMLAGNLRWSNDGWANARSFFVDDQDNDWQDALVGRRPSVLSSTGR